MNVGSGPFTSIDTSDDFTIYLEDIHVMRESPNARRSNLAHKLLEHLHMELAPCRPLHSDTMRTEDSGSRFAPVRRHRCMPNLRDFPSELCVELSKAIPQTFADKSSKIVRSVEIHYQAQRR